MSGILTPAKPPPATAKPSDVLVKNTTTAPVPVAGSVSATPAAKAVFKVQPQGTFNVNALPGGIRHQVSGSGCFTSKQVMIAGPAVPVGHVFVIESVSAQVRMPTDGVPADTPALLKKPLLTVGVDTPSDPAASTNPYLKHAGEYEFILPLQIEGSSIAWIPPTPADSTVNNGWDVYAGTISATMYLTGLSPGEEGAGSLMFRLERTDNQRIDNHYLKWSASGYLVKVA